MTPPGPAIAILAAGSSTRMAGADKLMLDLGGVTLLRQSVLRALATQRPVYVAMAASNAPRCAEIGDLPARQVPVASPGDGLATSLRAVADALPATTTGLLIALADMPDITTDDLSLLLDTFEKAGADTVVRATDQDGTPGNPVILPARLFAALTRLRGDMGARNLIKSEDKISVALPADHATVDLDTPEDWTNWVAKNPPG